MLLKERTPVRNMNCPECNSDKIHRSRRRGLYERLVLRRMNLRAYRCEACGARFVASIDGGNTSASKRSPRAARMAKRRMKHKLKSVALMIILGLAVSMLALRLASNSSPAPPPEQTANP